MAAISTSAEYAALREAIQLLTTLDSNGKPRDIVSFTVEGMQVSYSSSRLADYQRREEILAKRLTQRNIRKRVTPDFSGGSAFDSNYSGL